MNREPRLSGRRTPGDAFFPRQEILSALVIQSDGEVKDFESVAATIVDDPAIRNVILAPAGIVSHVYPLKGNERVLGLNYFLEGEGNREAVMAKKFGQLVLGGLFNLVQGGQAPGLFG